MFQKTRSFFLKKNELNARLPSRLPLILICIQGRCHDDPFFHQFVIPGRPASLCERLTGHRMLWTNRCEQCFFIDLEAVGVAQCTVGWSGPSSQRGGGGGRDPQEPDQPLPLPCLPYVMAWLEGRTVRFLPHRRVEGGSGPSLRWRRTQRGRGWTPSAWRTTS